MMRNWLYFGLFAAAVVGCKKKDQDAQNAQGFQQAQQGQYQQGQYPQQGMGGTAGTTQTTPPPQGSATQQGTQPPLGTVSGDPASLQNIIAGALSGGAATLGALTGGEMNIIEQGIKMKAQSDAKGMKSDGQLMSAKLQQDGHAQADLMLQPNKCYTIIGFGNPGVFRYQINLISSPPAPPQVLAQSGADSPAPTVGPNETCIKNPYPAPLQVKVDMHVVQGTGLVGAQVYSK
ncbi:MAG: hypothetical protein KC776_01040 [Myxococcales bacterium]|nr:hypothetical protein [Myxococcales bacterium]MCB9576543.1 hypothetical protein [Polyangiaceae bacterium]